MTVLFEGVQFLAGLSDGVTKRTMTQRTGEIFSVKDYGALGNGSHDDTSAIQAAIVACNNSTYGGGTVFFPPGNYIVSSTIDIGSHSGGHGYSIEGSGRWSAYINGTINNGFIFSLADGVNGPSRISNLSLVNASTIIGTGPLMFNNDTCGLIDNCHFTGMINILLPYNIFQTTILNCTGESNSNVTTGHVGTFAIAGFHCNVIGWRSTANFQAGIQFFGSNSATIFGCGIENCTIAYAAGIQTAWASACTVSGNVLTIGGNLGTLDGPAPFIVGTEIFLSGLSTTADWGISPLAASRCTITETNVQNPSRTGTGFAGTYTISRSATVSSPVPCIGRRLNTLSGTKWQALTSEACYYIMFVNSTAGVSFETVSGGSTVSECVDAFGNTGFSATAGFYLYGGSGACTFTSCTPNNNPTLASWYLDSSAIGQYTFVGCNGQKVTDSVTGTSSSITNGSGGAGTVLNFISATTGGSAGIGCRVFVGGSQVATIIGNHATDGTLTGFGGVGTYRVDTSLNVTGQAITIKWGDDWSIPAVDSVKTGLAFINTTSANLPVGYVTGLNSLNRTFNSLPGQAGANNNIPVFDGMEYAITDGLAGNCADGTCTTWGTNVTGGGGALHLQVRYNAATAHWTLTGK